MSDPTDATPDRPEMDAPTPDAPPPQVDGVQPGGPIGDETARIPVEPEVSWATAPEPARAMPWEAPAAVPPPAVVPPPAGPATPPTTDPAAPADPAATPTGVLSAATVGWVAPPPEPAATGQPGWVIASTGTRFVAYLIDGFICALLLGIGVGVAVAIAPSLARGGTAVEVGYGVASAGLYFVYFVGFWTGGAQATPGMRLLKLRVANASDGKRLAIGPATIRWLALGYIFTIVAIVPALVGLSFVAFIWWILLLTSTAMDKMHQGFHDRWAKSVIVRPQAAGPGGGAVVACLIIALIFMFLALVAIVGLIFLGSQVSQQLIDMGRSV